MILNSGKECLCLDIDCLPSDEGGHTDDVLGSLAVECLALELAYPDMSERRLEIGTNSISSVSIVDSRGEVPGISLLTTPAPEKGKRKSLRKPSEEPSSTSSCFLFIPEAIGLLR